MQEAERNYAHESVAATAPPRSSLEGAMAKLILALLVELVTDRPSFCCAVQLLKRRPGCKPMPGLEHQLMSDTIATSPARLEPVRTACLTQSARSCFQSSAIHRYAGDAAGLRKTG